MAEPSSSGEVKSIFGLEIVDYSITGDMNLCENHNFIIRIWVGQYMYFVNRSYASFCDLHMQLKRKYPKSEIPQIPLSGISIFSKRTTTVGSVAATGGGSIYSPPSKDLKTTIMQQIIEQKFTINSCLPIVSLPVFSTSTTSRLTEAFTGGSRSYSVAPSSAKRRSTTVFHKMDANEVVTQKIGPLSIYLNDLVKVPEIAISDNLLDFLDDESVDGEKIGILPCISLVDVMLAGETPRSKTIHSISSASFNVEKGQVVAWRFTTTNYDIGFGANLRNQDILPYQRYNSHLHEASGYLEIMESGPLNLYWDNTYSMMRNKSIVYSVKVLSPGDFSIAKNIVADAGKDKQRYQQQRQMVSRALHKLSITTLQERETQAIAICTSSPASRLAGIASGDSLEDSEVNVDLYEKMMKLEDEKRSLQLALAASEAALLEERGSSSSTSGKDSHEDVSTSSMKDSLEQEINDLKTQFIILRKRYEDDNGRNKTKIDQLTEALNEAQASKRAAASALTDVTRELNESRAAVESLTSKVHLHPDFLAVKADLQKLEQVANKLKIERMKLKKYAIEQKNENDLLKQELQRERSARSAMIMQAHQDYHDSFLPSPMSTSMSLRSSSPRVPSSGNLAGMALDESYHRYSCTSTSSSVAASGACDVDQDLALLLSQRNSNSSLCDFSGTTMPPLMLERPKLSYDSNASSHSSSFSTPYVSMSEGSATSATAATGSSFDWSAYSPSRGLASSSSVPAVGYSLERTSSYGSTVSAISMQPALGIADLCGEDIPNIRTSITPPSSTTTSTRTSGEDLSSSATALGQEKSSGVGNDSNSNGNNNNSSNNNSSSYSRGSSGSSFQNMMKSVSAVKTMVADLMVVAQQQQQQSTTDDVDDSKPSRDDSSSLISSSAAVAVAEEVSATKYDPPRPQPSILSLSPLESVSPITSPCSSSGSAVESGKSSPVPDSNALSASLRETYASTNSSSSTPRTSHSSFVHHHSSSRGSMHLTNDDVRGSNASATSTTSSSSSSLSMRPSAAATSQRRASVSSGKPKFGF